MTTNEKKGFFKRECGTLCGCADHAPARSWRHLDTMQFETVLRTRVPRCRCPQCGVKTISVPWASKSSRFKLMFSADGGQKTLPLVTCVSPFFCVSPGFNGTPQSGMVGFD
ncbi:MAG: transposase family protein [Planctomycetaceae bacterium]|nr:MAG: transposase family protein [Planctomycetaceae bacterium]